MRITVPRSTDVSLETQVSSLMVSEGTRIATASVEMGRRS